MIDKIILSRDRKNATIHFTDHDRHSVNFYHSEGQVMELVQELILDPITRYEERTRIANEDTVEIELQLSLFDDEKAA